MAGDARHTRFVLDLDRAITYRSFTLADPYRVVIDIPQVTFRLPPGTGREGRGLIKAFRYGMVMPGGSRIVIDLTGPARIASTSVLEPANGQPARLILDLDEADRTAFMQSVPAPGAEPRLATAAAGPAGPAVVPQILPSPVPVPAISPVPTRQAAANAAAPVPLPSPPPAAPAAGSKDGRPVVVIDPGHGGIDHGTQSGGEVLEKNLVLSFALALRDRIEKAGKYRVVMTRSDDTFIPLGERVRIARNHGAALFVSIHADALPRSEGDAQGATIYTLADRASDAEAQRLADAENKADAIGGVNLGEEPADVADILIDLVQRETRTFSNRFARQLMGELKTTVKLHKNPLKSAGFKVLKAPDVPSVLVELGYVSNKSDLEHLVSESWRSKAVTAMSQAIDTFLSKRLATAAPAK